MKWISALLATLIISGVALAQEKMQMPKPGPEVSKLDYFNGTWKWDGEMKPGLMGPGGKLTGTERNEWMEGKFFLVLHSDFQSSGSMPGFTSLAVMGYDPEEKIYTYHEFDSTGEAGTSKGTLNGDTWLWTNTEKMGGKTMRGRLTMKTLSPTQYTFKYEMAPEGGEFATVMEGKSTKQ